MNHLLCGLLIVLQVFCTTTAFARTPIKLRHVENSATSSAGQLNANFEQLKTWKKLIDYLKQNSPKSEAPFYAALDKKFDSKDLLPVASVAGDTISFSGLEGTLKILDANKGELLVNGKSWRIDNQKTFAQNLISILAVLSPKTAKFDWSIIPEAQAQLEDIQKNIDGIRNAMNTLLKFGTSAVFLAAGAFGALACVYYFGPCRVVMGVAALLGIGLFAAKAYGATPERLENFTCFDETPGKLTLTANYIGTDGKKMTVLINRDPSHNNQPVVAITQREGEEVGRIFLDTIDQKLQVTRTSGAEMTDQEKDHALLSIKGLIAICDDPTYREQVRLEIRKGFNVTPAGNTQSRTGKH